MQQNVKHLSASIAVCTICLIFAVGCRATLAYYQLSIPLLAGYGQ